MAVSERQARRGARPAPVVYEGAAVRLREATPADAPRVAALLAPREVWHGFGYEGAPTASQVRASLRDPEFLFLPLERVADGQPVGIIVVYGEPGPDASLECDIAISDPGARRQGLAREAVALFERYMFEGRRAGHLWSRVEAGNRACLELVRAIGWVSRGPEDVDGERLVFLEINRPHWKLLCESRAPSPAVG